MNGQPRRTISKQALEVPPGRRMADDGSCLNTVTHSRRTFVATTAPAAQRAAADPAHDRLDFSRQAAFNRPMCGRFTQAYTWAQLVALYRLTQPALNLEPRYNIAPTTTIDVVTRPASGAVSAFTSTGQAAA
jgi:hypothetical protein